MQQRTAGATTVSVARKLENVPHWQAALNATYRDTRRLFARIDVTGMGGYYFALPPNETTSRPCGLLNAKIGWETARWSAYVSGGNLLDKRYAVRGRAVSKSRAQAAAQPFAEIEAARDAQLRRPRSSPARVDAVDGCMGVIFRKWWRLLQI